MSFKVPQQTKEGGGGHLLEIRIICRPQKGTSQRGQEEIQRKR